MPAPALPVWALYLLGAAAVGLAILVTYFVTSSKAKARAAEYKKKVLRIIAVLRERMELLEEALRKAEQARKEAEARAEEASSRAARAEADREEAEREAAAQRERAARAAEAAVDLERQLAEARAEAEKWRREAEVAERLGKVAGAKLTPAIVLEIRSINAASAVLGGKAPRPEKAMEKLDETCEQLARGNARIAEILADLPSQIESTDGR